MATSCRLHFLFLQSEEAMDSGGLCVSVCLSVCPLSILLACTSPHPVHVHCGPLMCVCHLLLSVKCVIVEPLSVTAVDLLEHLTKSYIDQQHMLRMFSLLVRVCVSSWCIRCCNTAWAMFRFTGIWWWCYYLIQLHQRSLMECKMFWSQSNGASLNVCVCSWLSFGRGSVRDADGLMCSGQPEEWRTGHTSIL